MATKTRPLTDIRSKGRGKPKSGKGLGKILSQQSTQMVERRYQVVSMRREGYSIKEISDALGFSDVTVRKDIEAVLGQAITSTNETVEETRQLQMERLDGMLKFHYPLAVAGNLASASVVLQIEARRAKLLALDVPEVKVMQVSGIREYVGVDLEKV